MVNNDTKILTVTQKIIFFNQTTDTLKTIVLNDWNHAYSSKKSFLAQRFSDEFIRSFQLSSQKDRGYTNIISVVNANQQNIIWKRLEHQIDLIELLPEKPILPNQQYEFIINYVLKIPSNKFTGFGYDGQGNMMLKNCFLNVARYENHRFIKNSNLNIDDIATAISNFEIEITVPENIELTTDLNTNNTVDDSQKKGSKKYALAGNFKTSVNLFLQTKLDFYSYKFKNFEVLANIKNNKIDDIQKALLIEKITSFVSTNLGAYPHQKIIIAQDDYDRNPFYGLNQLPNFLNPFQEDFKYELKFLKTYLNNYLHTTLQLDARQDNWIFDGIQVYCMMKYIEEFYPNAKMMGSIARFKILKSFHLINLDFNEQYSYFYMLMARSNLDQVIGNSKDSFIKFNEKIAGKYRAGLSFKYLDAYLQNNILQKSMQQFIALNTERQTTRADFERLLRANTSKKIDWFFETIINSREAIDYKIKAVLQTNDSLTFMLKNKSIAAVPIPIYGLKNNKIVFKQWIDNVKTDSTITIKNYDIDKLVVNMNNEVPEFNLRNNFKKIGGFFPNNRPIKFAFMKDLENPSYNQILYVPAFNYNLYDGLITGLRLHNSTMLNRPFSFDIEPLYGIKSKAIAGGFSFTYNQIIRDSNLYNIRYGIFGATARFASDASYTKFNPVLSFSFRDQDFRKNARQSLIFRHVFVNREKSNFVQTENSENYSVFNARFGSGYNELTKQIYYNFDSQTADNFGKLSANLGIRKIYDDNRQLSFRAFAGAFLYNKTDSNFFSFALDRPTDYMFDYNYLGRSENSGLFSQQLIIAEGGFKTKTAAAFANQWLTSINGTATVWNWIELYSDVALFKNQNSNPKFAFDSGIRLNFVQDYFELYLPIYSSNGLDINSKNYGQKIRFIFTISTNTLASLFTRRWF